MNDAGAALIPLTALLSPDEDLPIISGRGKDVAIFRMRLCPHSLGQLPARSSLRAHYTPTTRTTRPLHACIKQKNRQCTTPIEMTS